jgi:hypothetical protein
MDRRKFMKAALAAGGAATLPLFGRFVNRARAGSPTGPTRIIVVTYPMGLAMQHWRPSAAGASFTLPYCTAPLEPFRERCLFVSNVDNEVLDLANTGSGHQMKQECALTGTLTMTGFGGTRRNTLEDVVAVTGDVPYDDVANGPSIDARVGTAIRTARQPRGAVSLGVDGHSIVATWDHKTDRTTSKFCFEAARTPAELLCNPAMTFTDLFAGLMTPPPADPAAEARRLRRQSVLDAVRGSFRDLRSTLPAADRVELDLHASYIRQLETDLGTRMGCSAPATVGARGSWDEAPQTELANLQIRNLAHAMACDMAPVARLEFVGQQNVHFGIASIDEMQAAWDRQDGPLDNSVGWHGIVHTGPSPAGEWSRPDDAFDRSGAFAPGLLDGYRFYVQAFADLLAELDRFVEGPDGRTVLDNSLVVLASDMGDGGGHWGRKMGYILAGNLGAARSGFHLDASTPGRTGWGDDTAYNHNHVLNTIGRIFGLRDESGAEMESVGLAGWARGSGVLPVF